MDNFFSDLGEGVVNLVHGDGAVGDIDKEVAAAVLEESDLGGLAGFGFLKMGGELGPVAPLDGRGDGGEDVEVEPGHVIEEFADLAGLPGELLFVGEVLVLAAAAFSKERAFGIESAGGGF